jgi:molybdate transport system substrate-binding protein
MPRALKTPLIGILLVLAGSWAQRPMAQTPPSEGQPPPGRLIDIGGRKLHLHCSGTGSPTVILMAGGGAFSIDWALVQPRVADTTRVCSYDRAGLGWSDHGPADETVEQAIADLHALLRAVREKGPYVLAGASIGGIFIRAYQRAFPDDVAGLVFSNSSNRVGISVKGKVGLIWDLTEDEVRSAFPLPASVQKRPAPTRVGEPFDRLPPDLQAVRLWLDVRLWEQSDPATAGPDSILSWRKEFLREFEETDAGQMRPLGELPVIVVSSGPVAGESERQSRAGAGARLNFLSSNTAHVTATGSGHEIHLYQPDVVVQALVRAVSAIRSRVPLSGASERPVLRVLTTRSIATVLEKIGSEFERQTGCELNVATDVAARMVRRINAGEPFDFLVAAPAQIDGLIRAGKIIPETRTNLARSGIGVAVRAGAPKPDVSSVDAFKRSLLTARSIAYLKEGQSGVYLAGVLERLGIAEHIRPKLTLPETDIVSELVSRGEIEIGMVVITQILTTPGVELAGPLPADIQSYVTFTGGVSTNSRAPDIAKELMKFLKSATALHVMRSQGMEPG